MMICPECHKALCKCPKGATQKLTGQHICPLCREEYETFKALFWHNLGCDEARLRLYFYQLRFRVNSRGEVMAFLRCTGCNEESDEPPHFCKRVQP
jgi:hypothetical protein